MSQKPRGSRKAAFTLLGVALLSVPIFVMLGGRPKLGLASGISIALGLALVVLGNARS